ncbi:hypothetical protein Loa_02383 [Legionella oakridgensis ATCC 33761 = DSM 21215]|uniref:Uncharacterized protein n=1 Tax=Legionella oakridgensis ATCC 33761 = DSM 21215 TaxID=1268635 RepID=W0BDI8_9GAMM|nr:hypothetical protein [Legionella oakridgensis]AHE67925.1 hypothetical protein Loa_02383 [Legionella oakridgensis ATCC 33761 = DSM 21215]
MTLSFSAVIPANIPPHETIVLPISMSQPLERGERLAAIIQSIRDHKYDDRTTILVCDFLNRHNSSDSSSLDQGETFLKEHETILKHFRIVRWQEFISSRNEVFLEKYAEVCDKNKDASHFYLKMKKHGKNA